MPSAQKIFTDDLVVKGDEIGLVERAPNSSDDEDEDEEDIDDIIDDNAGGAGGQLRGSSAVANGRSHRAHSGRASPQRWVCMPTVVQKPG